MQRPILATVVTALMMTGLLAPSAAPAPPSSLRDDPGTRPARAAITRLAPGLADRFVLRHQASARVDTFEVSTERGRIVLEGSDNVALVSAFSSYLEREAGGQVARGPDHIPDAAPPPEAPLQEASPYEHRYINNFTVGGYTTPNWDWERWEEELDLLAAHGVNMALVTVGQEAVWLDTFQDFGYSAEEVRNWIVATSHQPWQWMGNIEDTDSGLTEELIERRAALGRRVIDRMRELDITPVVPGFSGMVPPGFAERNPGAHIVPQGEWHDRRRPDWLDTTTDIYQDVAASYYRHQRERFGVLHAQAIDLLHEGGQSGDVPLDEAAQGIERALAASDPDYLWVIQAWQQNPRKELVEALDADHLLVLDLTHRQWDRTDAFHGAPWAWGEIGNFGGRLGLFGHLHEFARDLPAALASPDSGQLVGIAMMKEGNEQDPIVEQLWSHMSWERDEVDLDEWTRDYVEARYGSVDSDALAAWRILVEDAYTVQPRRRADSVLNAEPDLDARRAAQRQPDSLPYDPQRIEEAWRLLLKASPRLGRLDTFQYDLVDVTRQVIVNRGRAVLPEVKEAYLAGDRAAFSRASEDFLNLHDYAESVLSTREEFLFGPWVEDARSWGTTPEERRTLVQEAKRLLTIWSFNRPGFENLKEYANRDWAGLISGYYQPRWELYFETLDEALATGEEPEPIDWFSYGQAFVAEDDARFETEPSGNPVRVSRSVAEQLRSPTPPGR